MDMSKKPKEEASYNPFIDFYNKHNVIPVSQDLGNIDEFIFRRNFLYTKLGVPLSQFAGKRVIEFGPGGGFNAVATSSWRPNVYVFVDASTAGLAELRRKQDANLFSARNVEIVESLISDFRDDRRFDCVIIEGTIPGQKQPAEMLKHVARFVERGGFLFTTTTSASSFLSEICRRLLKIRILEHTRDFEQQIQIASNIFATHLQALGTSTRPIKDWVLDVIFNDWHKGQYVFSMLDCIDALQENFDFYQSMPSFLVDDRWYKKVDSVSRGQNEILHEQYSNLAGCLIDYRISLKEVMKFTSRMTDVELLSKQACDVHDDMMNTQSYRRLGDFYGIIDDIKKCLPAEFSLTVSALTDFRAGLNRFIDDPKDVQFGSFEKWWGRGQQYVSLIRKS